MIGIGTWSEDPYATLKWYLEKAEDLWRPTVDVPIDGNFRQLDSLGNNTRPFKWPDKDEMTLIFLKCFDPEGQQLIGQRPIYVRRKDNMSKLLPIIIDVMGWKHGPGGQGINIVMLEEVNPLRIDGCGPGLVSTFDERGIINGDIIVFMRGPYSTTLLN
jgi:hypothetical protein